MRKTFAHQKVTTLDQWLNRIALGLAATLAVLMSVGVARAQSGSFVIPSIRAGGGTDFAYWDLFAAPPGGGANFNYNNPPALFFGEDDDGNPTTAFTARTNFRQIGTNTCFVTSSGALYSFSTPTVFEVPYTPPVASLGEVTNVIFQTQTGGSRLDLNTIRLVFTRPLGGGGTETVELPPLFRALDDPQTGGFSERLISAFQWNLTGQNVRDFKVAFSSPGPSMPLWQSQLDVTIGTPFVQELGYLLYTNAQPFVRHGRPGSVDKNVPSGIDGRFFFPGDSWTLLGSPEFDWEHVGFLYNGQVTAGYELPFVFPNGDATVTALFAPLTYDAWREALFVHFNNLTGTPADNTDPAVSDPDIDHDKDGLLNVAEYAFGCDPYTPDAERAASVPITVDVGGTRHPAVRYRTNGAPDGWADISIVVSTSTDLLTWKNNLTEALPVTEVIETELLPDGSTFITTRALTPLASGGLFFRIEVQ